MLTSRARTFLIAAGVFYLFANQTQVGWLYVISAVMGGLVLASFWISRGLLRYLDGDRHIGIDADADLFEGDEVSVHLAISNQRGTVSQIRLLEACPLAAPDDTVRALSVFIPSLSAHEHVDLDYNVTIDRRGLHTFPPVKLSSNAPFGFFAHKRDLSIPTRVLVYPEVRPLHHLNLLDRQLAPQVPRLRSGFGYEVMGVRPFRSGDSPRHIHWRSVARTGELISKEFADEVQPGLSLILDLFAHPYPETASKHTALEWAVKCAASIGDYARVKGYPLHLLADSDALPLPTGPVDRWSLLQYLARVQPTGIQSVDKVLGQQALQAFAAVILPWPDRRAIEPLVELHHRRIEILAVVIDPATFPNAGPSAAPLVDELRGIGIEVCHVKFGRDWAEQITDTVIASGSPVPLAPVHTR